MSPIHPSLTQFEREMSKGEVTARKRDDFDKWRQKQEPESELRKAADDLWARYQQKGAPVQPRGPAPSRASAPSRSGRSTSRGSGRGARGDGGREAARAPAPVRREEPRGAPASVLGEPFHNPYTFIPFGSPEHPPERRLPTPLTIDELEKERMSGMLELRVRALSPLLTCRPEPVDVDPTAGHKTYAVLAIGEDAIIPATGVRGALRTLLTVLTGGTLGYVDELAWLCQGRDAPLGPRGKTDNGSPRNVFLARVVKPGAPNRAGLVALGRTKLEKEEALRVRDDERPGKDRRQQELTRSSEGENWSLRLSGKPINRKGKREGLFVSSGEPAARIELPANLWEDYQGRHRHADFPELREGDLVWLEPLDPECERICRAEDVRSIQWARWGRRGERLLDVLTREHPEVLPDNRRTDGKVDEVTDLFGQVPLDKGAARAFAARVRPENLVFRGGARAVDRITLAPLMAPHPGCAAFYRNALGPDHVENANLPLRGYKVYRTTSEVGPDAPWHYEIQGVFDNDELARPGRVSKTSDLLRAGSEGTLRIAFRALSRRELALLVAACSVDWRLGGGKPLGLGHCRVVETVVLGEDGLAARLANGTDIDRMVRPGDDLGALPSWVSEELGPALVERIALWQATQRPVGKLRYPRAKNDRQRGGHAWFGKHASPQKGTGSRQHGKGLQPVWVRGELQGHAGSDRIEGQILPRFDASDPLADLLYGYDIVFLDPEQDRDRRTRFARAEKSPPPVRNAPRRDRR